MAEDNNAMDELNWTTDNGADVTVTADAGKFRVTADHPAFSATNVPAFLETHDGREVLNCGRHRVGGEMQDVQLPIGDRRDDLEALRENSKSDEPLAYGVVETTRSMRTDGWGDGERTVQKLSATKTTREMTDREKELHRKIDTEHDVPEDAEAGDTFTPDDLLADPRTDDEREQDALEEAAETGDDVTIWKRTASCNDAGKECNLDHVQKVATPEGEIETRRTHTF